jgi:hypothetical protein
MTMCSDNNLPALAAIPTGCSRPARQTAARGREIQDKHPATAPALSPGTSTRPGTPYAIHVGIRPAHWTVRARLGLSLSSFWPADAMRASLECRPIEIAEPFLRWRQNFTLFYTWTSWGWRRIETIGSAQGLSGGGRPRAPQPSADRGGELLSRTGKAMAFPVPVCGRSIVHARILKGPSDRPVDRPAWPSLLRQLAASRPLKIR